MFVSLAKQTEVVSANHTREVESTCNHRRPAIAVNITKPQDKHVVDTIFLIYRK